MKVKTKATTRMHTARNSRELGEILGLSEADTAVMELKGEMSRIAVKAIAESDLGVNEIVKRSGVARSKVSAVKNGATISVSIDLLVKIIVAAGGELKIKAA